MNIATGNDSQRDPASEYDEEIMYAGWNPDVALLVHQRQMRNDGARHAEQLCSLEQVYLLQGQYPFTQ